MFQLLLSGKRLITVFPLAVSSAWGSESPGLTKTVSVLSVSANWTVSFAPKTPKTRSVADVPAAVWSDDVPSTQKTVYPGIVSTDVDWAAAAPALAKLRSVLPASSAWASVAPETPKTRSVLAVPAVWSSGVVGLAKTVNMPFVLSATEAEWTATVPLLKKAVTPLPSATSWSVGLPGTTKQVNPASGTAVWSDGVVGLTKTVNMPLVSTTEAEWSTAVPLLKKTVTQAYGTGFLRWSPPEGDAPYLADDPAPSITKTVHMPFVVDGWTTFAPTTQKTVHPPLRPMYWSLHSPLLKKTVSATPVVLLFGYGHVTTPKEVSLEYTGDTRLTWVGGYPVLSPATPKTVNMPLVSTTEAEWSAIAPSHYRTVRPASAILSWSVGEKAPARTYHFDAAAAAWSSPGTGSAKTVHMPLVSTTEAEWSAAVPLLKKTVHQAFEYQRSQARWQPSGPWQDPGPSIAKTVHMPFVVDGWTTFPPTTQKQVNQTLVPVAWSASAPSHYRTVRPASAALSWSSVGEATFSRTYHPEAVVADWSSPGAGTARTVHMPLVSTTEAEWSAIAPSHYRTVRPASAALSWSGVGEATFPRVYHLEAAVADWSSPGTGSAKTVNMPFPTLGGRLFWLAAFAPVVYKTVRPAPAALSWSGVGDVALPRAYYTEPPSAHWLVQYPQRFTKTVRMPLVSATQLVWVAAVPLLKKRVTQGYATGRLVWSGIGDVLLPRAYRPEPVSANWLTPYPQRSKTVHMPLVSVAQSEWSATVPLLKKRVTQGYATGWLVWSVGEVAPLRTYHFEPVSAGHWLVQYPQRFTKTVHAVLGGAEWSAVAPPTIKSLPTSSIPVANWSAVTPATPKFRVVAQASANWTTGVPATPKTVNMGPVFAGQKARWYVAAPTTPKTVHADAQPSEWAVGIPTLKKQTRNLLPVSASWSVSVSNTSRTVNPDAVAVSWSAVVGITRKKVYPDFLLDVLTVLADWSAPDPLVVKTVSVAPETLTWAVALVPETIKVQPDPVVLAWKIFNVPVAVDPVSVNWTAATPEIPRTVRPEPVSTSWLAQTPGLHGKKVNPPSSALVWTVPAPGRSTLVHATIASTNWTPVSPVHSKKARPGAISASWSTASVSETKTRSTTPAVANWSATDTGTSAPKHTYPEPAVAEWSTLDAQVQFSDVIYPASVIINWSVESPTTGKLRSVSVVPSAAWSAPEPYAVLVGEEDNSAFLLFVGW